MVSTKWKEALDKARPYTVTAEKQGFTIRASASRLEKGLLAKPQKFNDLFPRERGQIQVVLDDENRPKALTFHPYDRTVKESRIFGLAPWFAKRDIREGDSISITLEDRQRRLYRIVLDRFVREQQEQNARQKLRLARTDAEAEQELKTLALLTGKRPPISAQEELLRIAQDSPRHPRPRVFPPRAERHEGVPSGIRVLLRELHHGRCQLCSFTFEKRNGRPYFEIHHLDPKVGHHPTNLLVVCPNCHAEFEHATVTDFIWADNWLLSVTINGKRALTRQPLVQNSIKKVLLGLGIVIAAMQIGRFIVR